MTEPDQTMTRTERMDLVRIVKLNASVAKRDIEAVAASRKASVEDQLAREFRAEDERWRVIIADARIRVDEAQAQIDKLLESAGVPDEFRPELGLTWRARGVNGDPKRRAELRRVAHTRIEADAKNAKASIERAEVASTAELLASGITSAEGLAALERIPTPEQLIPNIDIAELEAARAALHAQLTSQPYGSRGGLSLEGYRDQLGWAGGKQPGDNAGYGW